MIRLIASDMDGTLLDENGRVPEETYDLIRALRARGVRFVASSGRRYDTLRWFLEPVADQIDYVASLGTQVYADGQLLDREVFSTLSVMRLFETCAMFDCLHLAVYEDDATYLIDDLSTCSPSPTKTSIEPRSRRTRSRSTPRASAPAGTGAAR